MPHIDIWERKAGTHRAAEDNRHWQADIWLDKTDHHGIGETQSEALFNAAFHWFKHDAKHPQNQAQVIEQGE